MDRHAPTMRPAGRNAGVQRWRELLFVHWPVPPDLIRPLLPARLGLDLWDERAWLGIVPFSMQDIAPSWWPNALAFNFLECNLRTYVHLEGANPGVYFFSLEASSWLAVQAARVGWGLPYHHAKMSFEKRGDESRFATHRRASHAHCTARYRIGERLGPSALGTREHFFLERYLLYAHKRGQLVRGQVHHAPYPAHRAELLELDQSLISAAGVPDPEGPPQLVHFAPGVDVEVFAPYPV